MTDTTRPYVRLTEAGWMQAAELSARGMSQQEIADQLGTSLRSVATHLPDALERRRHALAASPTGSVTTGTSTPIGAPALPDVAERDAATRHWRSAAWSDAQALQTKLRALTAEPVPDARAIRAISAAAMALKDLVRLGSDILDVDRQAADEVIPELVIRELTAEEVDEIRRKQRAQDGGDLAELVALESEPDGGEIVVEG